MATSMLLEWIQVTFIKRQLIFCEWSIRVMVYVIGECSVRFNEGWWRPEATKRKGGIFDSRTYLSRKSSVLVKQAMIHSLDMSVNAALGRAFCVLLSQIKGGPDVNCLNYGKINDNKSFGILDTCADTNCCSFGRSGKQQNLDEISAHTLNNSFLILISFYGSNDSLLYSRPHCGRPLLRLRHHIYLLSSN